MGSRSIRLAEDKVLRGSAFPQERGRLRRSRGPRAGGQPPRQEQIELGRPEHRRFVSCYRWSGQEPVWTQGRAEPPEQSLPTTVALVFHTIVLSARTLLC